MANTKKPLDLFALTRPGALAQKRSKEAIVKEMKGQGYEYSETAGGIPKGSTMLTRNYKYNSPIGGPHGRSLKENSVEAFFYKKAPEAAPAAAPAATAPAPAPAPVAPVAGTAAGNPALTIPGVDSRIVGENLGVKPAESEAKKKGLTSKGTSRLTIARSAGGSGINLG